jgi:hypothetical protein
MQQLLSLEGEMENEDVERKSEWNGRARGRGTPSGVDLAAAAAALLGEV